MPKITVDVLDLGSPRVKVGKGPIATAYDVEHDDPLSAAGQFSFKVPCRDTKSAYLITQQRSVNIYADGVLKFVGIVERKRRVATAGNAYFEVSGYALVRELADEIIESLTLASGSAGVSNAPAQVLATHSKSWSLDSTNGYATTAGSYYGRMVGPTVLKSLTRIQERTGEHWIYRPSLSGADRKVIWLRNVGTASGYRAIAHAGDAKALETNPYVMPITNFEEIEDGYELVNRVYVRGAGQDIERASVDIQSTTITSDSTFTVNAAANYVQYAPSGYGYRTREVLLQFEDIAPISNTTADVQAAADMLVRSAKAWLPKRAVLAKFYRMQVLKVPADLLPGQTVRAVIKELRLSTGEVIHDIDDDFFVLNIKSSYNPGGVIYDLDIASVDRPPVDEDEETYTELEKTQISQTYTQIGPTAYIIPFDEDFDSSAAAVLPFWLGAWIFKIQQVLLWFRVEPLHSTVKSVGGEASVEVTINSLDVDVTVDTVNVSVSTSVSVSGTIDTSHDHVVPSGSQYILLNEGSGGADLTLFTGSGDLATLAYNGSSGNRRVLVSGTATTESGGSSSLALSGSGSGSGTGTGTGSGSGTGTGSGTADLSTAISAEYGIYEESDSEKIIRTNNATNLNADCTITVNGGAYSGAIVAAGVSGWYALDLTDDLIDSNFRPTQEINSIEIAAVFNTGAGKARTGRIKAQLLIRASIQAVANL